MTKEDFEKLQQSFATEKKKYEESKGYSDTKQPSDDPMYNMMRYMDSSLSYIYDRINGMDNDFYDYKNTHKNGHLPKMTPTAMAKMLKMCGMDEDYEIIKPTINMSKASVDKRGNIIVESNWADKKT